MTFCISMLGCNNEAKTNFEELSKDFDRSVLSDMSDAAIQRLAERIESHLSRFPDYEQNYVLTGFKEKIIMHLENKAFEKLLQYVGELESKTFNDYDEATNTLNEAKNAIDEYTSQSRNENNISIAKSKSEKISMQINSITYERNDYYNAVNSNSVYEIEMFVNKYPNSVMRNSLLSKIDEIYYSEFVDGFDPSPRSINDLNGSVSRVKSFSSKFRSIEFKSKLNELAVSLESQRRPILEAELQDNLQVLIERMENEARSKAERTHPTYKVEMCVARGSNPEVVGYSSNFERVYQVNMKGAFLGIDKREMMIAVSGRIKGDLQSGVSIIVTGSRIQSDNKF